MTNLKGNKYYKIEDKKPKNMTIVGLILKDGNTQDAITIDTGFGLEFRKDNENFIAFEEDVKMWCYFN